MAPARLCLTTSVIPIGATYIGRGEPQCGIGKSIWANPFPISKARSREEAVEAYDSYFGLQQPLADRLPLLAGVRLA